MTIAQSAEILAEIVHGARFAASTEDLHWRRMTPLLANHA
jgi:hypothetical protein